MADHGSHHRVFDSGAVRSWEPKQKASMERIEFILDLVIQMNEFTQKELVEALRESHSHLAFGTCAANVSASLLYFLELDLVEVVQASRPTIWRVK